jgi:uncharacterized protein YlzI (FlbEa/FlbD family)
MIRLTNTMNESEWIAPEQIRNIRKDNGSLPRTRVFLDSGNYVLVTESPEEVVRKIMEYKLAMIRYEALARSFSLSADAKYGEESWKRIYRLAGLEEAPDAQ